MKIQTGTFKNTGDGKVYKTVKLGEQTWMAENLNVSTYRNGDSIPHLKDDKKWGDNATGAWCDYGNDAKNQAKFGKLYNWYAVNNPLGLAPEGWHIPSDEEWKALEIFLGMSQENANKKGWRGEDQGAKLKEQGLVHWNTQNDNSNDSVGFTARPGGYRDVSGEFFVNGYACYWWSSSKHLDYFAWYRTIYYTSDKIHRTTGYVGDGFSVRCILDSTAL